MFPTAVWACAKALAATARTTAGVDFAASRAALASSTARIRVELVEILDTPSGRFAELVAITELLHAATHGDHLTLAEPLRQRASLLLGRTVPVLI